jgi:hypothetical protein
VGDSGTTSGVTITSSGTGNFTINTNNGTTTGSLSIASGANGNISITPNGTGRVVTTQLNYNESVFAMGTTSSSTLYPQPNLGNIHTVTLNTSTFTLQPFTGTLQTGGSVTLFITGGTTAPAAITQAGTGTWKWAGGSKSLSGVTGTTDIVSMFYDGTTYYVSINKGFV